MAFYFRIKKLICHDWKTIELTLKYCLFDDIF